MHGFSKFVSIYLRLFSMYSFSFEHSIKSNLLWPTRTKKKNWDYYITLIIFYYNFSNNILSSIEKREKKVNCPLFAHPTLLFKWFAKTLNFFFWYFSDRIFAMFFFLFVFNYICSFICGFLGKIIHVHLDNIK